MSNIVVDPAEQSADVEVENTVEPDETLSIGEAETQEPAFAVPDKWLRQQRGNAKKVRILKVD